MATKRKIPLNRIEGVGAGSTAVIQLPRNVRYHGICLTYGTDTAGGASQANMEAEISNIYVDIDEVSQRTASAEQLFAINGTKGASVTDGNLPLFFTEPQRNTQPERELTSWGMLGVEDFQIRVDIADAGQVATLSGFAIVDDVQQSPSGIIKWKRNKITNSSTGELPYSLPTERGDSYQGVYLFEEQAGDISDVLCEWDGTKVNDLSASENEAYLTYFSNAVSVVAGMYHIPFDDNNPVDALRTLKNVQGAQRKVEELIVTMTMAGARDVTVIREMLGSPD